VPGDVSDRRLDARHVEWFNEHLRRVRNGYVQITYHMRDGEVAYVEKIPRETEKPECDEEPDLPDCNNDAII
jgi:hypothetical protein